MRSIGRGSSTEQHIGRGEQHPYRVLLVVCALLAEAPAVHADVTWTDYATGTRRAAAEGKPVFLDFRADWCGPCKMLEKQTFPDAEVRKLLARCVTARVDVDRDPQIARRFGVNSIPRLIVISGGKRVLDVTGFMPAADLRQELQAALSGKPVLQPAGDAVPGPAPESPEVAALRSHVRDGTYAAWHSREPAKALKALAGQVVRLGSFDNVERQDAEELVSKAGVDGVSALVAGLAHPVLAVRVASHQLLTRLVAEVHHVPATSQPPYDPWAPTVQRGAAAKAWAAWWASRMSTARR